MNLKDLTFLFNTAAAEGADQVLKNSQLLDAMITKAEAFRIYGRSTVERWLKEGLITLNYKKGDSPKHGIDRLKLDAVAAASNRTTYLPVADR